MRLAAPAGICTPVCPTNDTLLCYFERGLAPTVAQQIAAHLDECEGCRTVLIILVRDRKFCLEVRGSRSSRF